MSVNEPDYVSRKTIETSILSVEIVEQRITETAPVTFYTSLPYHTLYAEFNGGFLYEREVDGFGQSTFISEPETVSFCPAGSVVRGRTSGSGILRYGVVQINPYCAEIRDSVADMPTGWVPFTGLKSARLWKEVLPLFTGYTSKDDVALRLKRFYALGRAIALLAMLADEMTDKAGSYQYDRRIAKAMDWISVNMTKDFSLRELAGTAGVSTSQLIRLFRQFVGMTPMAYVSMQRMQEAQRLLANSDWSIVKVAAHLGYNDQSHFTKRFHRVTGVTPAAFRRKR
jgi:AraC family transcriptional regulator